jgi:hypothetical protein
VSHDQVVQRLAGAAHTRTSELRSPRVCSPHGLTGHAGLACSHAHSSHLATAKRTSAWRCWRAGSAVALCSMFCGRTSSSISNTKRCNLPVANDAVNLHSAISCCKPNAAPLSLPRAGPACSSARAHENTSVCVSPWWLVARQQELASDLLVYYTSKCCICAYLWLRRQCQQPMGIGSVQQRGQARIVRDTQAFQLQAFD